MNLPNPLRYRDLAYVALNVSDLDKSVWFYADMVGLELVSRDDNHAFLRCSDSHHDIVLVRSATPGVKRIGWRMESAQACAEARAHFTRLDLDPVGVAPAEAASLGISADAFRIVEPNTRAVMEFFSEMGAAPAPFVPTVAKISQLGHVVLCVSDYAATRRFVEDQMNFKVSDTIGEAVTFYRCFPNPYHHSFALAQAKRNSLHHLNFMVSEIDDIGKAMNRFRENGIPVSYGPGRHPTSTSVFFYFIDPDGHWIEYSYGMEEIPEIGGRDARHFAMAQASFDSWGGKPDPNYRHVGQIETMGAQD